MRRDESNQIVDRDPGNPHALPPMLTADGFSILTEEERQARRDALELVRTSAETAMDFIETVKARALAKEPHVLPDIEWWTA